MSTKRFKPLNLEQLIEQTFPDISPEAKAAMLAGSGNRYSMWQRPEPKLGSVPTTTRGFRIRVDLLHTKPPVWRRIEVPGDIKLPELHNVLQAAMGWTDSHLHRFRTGNDRNAPEFLTDFDLEEGEEGVLEDDVRLDQVIAAKSDRLWYDYDFGDGWKHVLRVEQVLDTPPQSPRCVTGKLACPPEDCGGVWGYSELADWVRNDYADALRPPIFDSAKEAHAWLPEGWHPDIFDLDETNEMITEVASYQALSAEEFAALLQEQQPE